MSTGTFILLFFFLIFVPCLAGWRLGGWLWRKTSWAQKK
jgi:hypothetical protein